MKQSSLDEQEQIGLEMDTPPAEGEDDLSDYFRTFVEPSSMNASASGVTGENLKFYLYGKSLMNFK